MAIFNSAVIHGSLNGVLQRGTVAGVAVKIAVLLGTTLCMTMQTFLIVKSLNVNEYGISSVQGEVWA